MTFLYTIVDWKGEDLMKKLRIIFSLLFVALLTTSCDLLQRLNSNSSQSQPSSISSTSSSSLQTSGDYLYPSIEEELTVHFLDLNVSGDCILIDYGNYEILIDAGGNKSAGTNIIVPYLNQYVEDQCIELMIATHGHEDHIAGFVGLSNQASVLKDFSFGTIVDLGEGYENLNSSNELTALQKQYNELRDQKIEEGSQYYTIRDLYKENKTVWEIAPQLTFSFLETKFYNIPYTKHTQNLNNYSIATQLKFEDKTFLFTGDLEEEGESSLLEMNQLSKVNIFKAGHHGSNTASQEALLEVIQPDIAIFTADSSKESTYNFPHPETIERLVPYTSQFYTSYYNGHIQVKLLSSEKNIDIECSERNELFSYVAYLNCYPTIQAIASIGSKITIESETKIENAESLYNRLTEDEKTYVYNYPTLLEAREKFNQL